MRLPLRLNEIEQEHLQELYDAGGTARDDLPYTEAFEKLYQGFQDRTFKNATREQLYGALLRYVRSSRCPATSQAPGPDLTAEQLTKLQIILRRLAGAKKILPYSEEFETARQEFVRLMHLELPERDFWLATLRAQGPKRKPPRAVAQPHS